MPRRRIPHGVIDSVLAKLFEATSSPHRVVQVSNELSQLIPRVSNVAHRQYCERKLQEIERFQNSQRDLSRISDEIEAWIDREFPG